MTKKMTMMPICRNTICGEMTMMMKLKPPRSPSKKVLLKNLRLRPPKVPLPHLLRGVPVEIPDQKPKNAPVLDHVRHAPITNHPVPTAEGPVRPVARAMHLTPSRFHPEPVTVAVPVPGPRPDLVRTTVAPNIGHAPITVRKVVHPFTIIRKANTPKDHAVNRLNLPSLLTRTTFKHARHVFVDSFRFSIIRVSCAVPYFDQCQLQISLFPNYTPLVRSIRLTSL